MGGFQKPFLMNSLYLNDLSLCNVKDEALRIIGNVVKIDSYLVDPLVEKDWTKASNVVFFYSLIETKIEGTASVENFEK